MAADPYQLRRAPTIHHYSNSREDLDSEIGSVEFATYTVQIPPTPDNQPMETPVENEKKLERSCTSNSMFTGGHNCATRAHLKEKMTEFQTSHPQIASAKGSYCAMSGCDAQVITDDLAPCECEYKICRDCYKDALATGDGICPGCKEPYRSHDVPELNRRSSFAESKSQSDEFDYTQFLFESKTNYGYGNAVWPTDGVNDNDEGSSGVPKTFVEKQWKMLTREVKISTAVIAPYRILILVRMIVIGGSQILMKKQCGCGACLWFVKSGLLFLGYWTSSQSSVQLTVLLTLMF